MSLATHAFPLVAFVLFFFSEQVPMTFATALDQLEALDPRVRDDVSVAYINPALTADPEPLPGVEVCGWWLARVGRARGERKRACSRPMHDMHGCVVSGFGLLWGGAHKHACLSQRIVRAAVLFCPHSLALGHARKRTPVAEKCLV